MNAVIAGANGEIVSELISDFSNRRGFSAEAVRSYKTKVKNENNSLFFF